MRTQVLLILKYLIIAYWSIFFIIIASLAYRHGVKWQRFKINQKPRENFKLVKGFILGVILIINYFVISGLSSACIEILGKNNLVSPYVFFTLIVFVGEYVGFLFINNDFRFSELSIFGTRWTQNDELGFMEYRELSETTIARIRTKLTSANKVMTSLSETCREAIEKTKNSSDVAPYITQLQSIVDEYINMQDDSKEENLSIKIYFDDGKNYDKIKIEYKLSKYDFKRIHDDVIRDRGMVILEESEKNVIAMAVQSKLLTEPYIVVISHDDNFILSDEATIVQSILVAVDQAVEVGMVPQKKK